jgi:DNA gyrase subunit A
MTDGTQEIILATRSGKAVRFPEKEVREMGRTAAGVKGVRLEKSDRLIGMVTVLRGATLLVVSENGYGKRSTVQDYRITRRGGKGVISIKTTERIGMLVSIRCVYDSEDLMIITSRGQIIRLPIKGIPIIGRNTQGVRLIRLNKGDRVADVARIMEGEDT